METIPRTGGEGTQKLAVVDKGEGCGEGPRLENVVEFELEDEREEGIMWLREVDASNSS